MPAAGAAQVSLAGGLARDLPRSPVVVRVWRDDAPWAVVPTESGTATVLPGAVLPCTSLTLVTVGREADVARRVRALPEELWPADREVELVRAAAHTTDRRWVRALVGALDLPGAAAVGRGVPGGEVLRWDETGMTLHAIGVGTWSWPVRVEPVPPGCPVRWETDAGPCVPAGGPWVSASMEVAATWRAAHDELVAALGCPLEPRRCGRR